MNSRILERAATRAGMNLTASGNHWYIDGDPGQELDRFAEILVKECINIVSKNVFCKVSGIDKEIEEYFGLE